MQPHPYLALAGAIKLTEEDPLPCSQLQASALHEHCNRGAHHAGLDMGGGVSFPVAVAGVSPGNDSPKHVDHVMDYIRVGMLVDRHTSRGMRDIHDHHAIGHLRIVNQRLHLIGKLNKLSVMRGFDPNLLHNRVKIWQVAWSGKLNRTHMNDIVVQELLTLILLLIGSGFFSSAETIFFSLSRLQLRRISERHPAIGGRLHHMVTHPARLLSTILIGNTIVNVAAAAVGYAIADNLFKGHGELVAIPAITVMLIIFGEVAPKRIGLYYAEQISIVYTPVFSAITIILTPLRLLLEMITRVFEPLLRPHGKSLSSDEFETVLEIGNEAGALNADELAMLKAIVSLEDLTAADVMTPRVDIVGIDLDDASLEISHHLETARRARRKFLILYHDSLDQVTGFLDVRQFLLDPEHSIEAATIRPFFVPVSAPLNRLLTEFQRDHRRIAMVVDEYGGTSGVITRGDILEEITGEIYQELNKPRPLFQAAGPNRWLVDANFSLEELNRKLDIDLDSEGGDRLAGWIAEHAGHLPQKDDVVEAQGCRVTVLQTIRLRVTLAMIEKLEIADAEADKEESTDDRD